MVLNLAGRKTVALLMEPNLRILSLRCSVISLVTIFMCWLCFVLPFFFHQKLEIKVLSENKPVCVNTEGALGFVFSLKPERRSKGVQRVHSEARRFVKGGGNLPTGREEGSTCIP